MVERLFGAVYFGLGVPIAERILSAAANRSEKIREALQGRRLPREAPVREGEAALWFHVSSLGEFEQARPIVEAVAARRPTNVWVSFFSPSGLAHAEGYPGAVDLFYLPFRRGDLQKSFDIIGPSAVVVIGGDLWPGLVWEAHARGIPVVLVDATLRPASARNHPLARALLRSFYRHLSCVLAVTEADAVALRRLCGPTVPVKVAGDSRYDRVWERATASTSLGSLDAILRGAPRPLLVAGSTHEPEERVLADALRTLGGAAPPSVVVVPHEPREDRLRSCEELFCEAGFSPRRLSRLAPGEPWRLLVLDRVGVLAECYRHADYVMVGGSFKGKVHNVMEPAAWAKPIVVGPRYANSPEAIGMVASGGIVAVEDAAGVARALRSWIDDPARAAHCGRKACDYLVERLGASARIASAIEELVYGARP